jgi:hypothetical protein
MSGALLWVLRVVFRPNVRIFSRQSVRHPACVLGVDVTDGAEGAPSVRITTAIPPRHTLARCVSTRITGVPDAVIPVPLTQATRC